MAAVGSIVSFGGSIGLDTRPDADQSFDLRSGGPAQLALSGHSGSVSIIFLAGHADSVLRVHVRTRLCNGESAHHQACRVSSVAAQYAIFPVINATLNGTSAVLLLVGHNLIKRGRMAAHRAVMISAVVTSSLFLTSYLYYHYHVGSVRFPGQGWSRPVYYSILISHTLLAITIVPLVI